MVQKKVLVTGAGGFIGRYVVPILNKFGFEIHALSRNKCKSSHGVEWHAVDLFEDGASEKIIKKVQPTHLLHLAWYAEPGRFWMAPENFQWVRVTLALLQQFVEQGGRRVVMAGSCAEYDWQYGWCSEFVTPLMPSTVYGTCKNSLQNLLGSFSKEYELSSAWGRVFFLYGPYEHPTRLVSSVISSLLRNEYAKCTSGEQVRDFLHVKDVASAFVALLDSELQGPVNIASGEGVSIKDVVNIISKKLGRSELLKLGVKSIPVNEPPLLVADVRRLHQELQWKPSIGLEQGIEDAISWWRKHLNKQ